MVSDIGWAMMELRAGGRVRRRGWNGKGMHLALATEPLIEGCPAKPFVYIITVENMPVPWTCSQSDLLATDWENVFDDELPLTK